MHMEYLVSTVSATPSNTTFFVDSCQPKYHCGLTKEFVCTPTHTHGSVFSRVLQNKKLLPEKYLATITKRST